MKSLWKIAEFQEVVPRKNPDLILACETKLSVDQATYSFLPPNYIAYRKDRIEHRGGVIRWSTKMISLCPNQPFLI